MNQKDKPNAQGRAKDNRMMPSNPCLDSKANGTAANHQKSPNSHEGKQKPS
jgi:hypothetical protein